MAHFSAIQAALLRLALVLFVACGGSQEADPALGTLGAGIVGGAPSPAAQDAVVLLTRSGFDGTCTGSVVSPTLILTARHCFFELLDPDEPRLCGDRGGTRPVVRAFPLESFAVFSGHEKPLAELPAQPRELHSSTSLDTCDNDIALLEVDSPLGIEPLALRLDQPPVVGEVGTLVGWGATLEQADTPLGENWRLPDTRQQREIRVEALSSSSYEPEGGVARTVEASGFAGTEGGCFGDSGGPLLSNTTGAIIGVQYVIERAALEATGSQNVIDACLRGATQFQRLDLQKDWIRTAFRGTSAAPWLEGRPQPRALGETCETPDDCLSGLCASAGASSFCSRHCEREVCPEGFECVTADLGTPICGLGDIQGIGPPPSAACSFAAPPPRPTWPVLALFTLLALPGRRASRRSRCEPDSSP